MNIQSLFCARTTKKGKVEKIEAETALSWGLLDAIVSVEELETEVTRLAQDALSAKPEILKSIKLLCDP